MTPSTYEVLKRGLDVAVAATGLVVTAPVQALAAAAVRGTMGSPVLFRQTRPGLDGKPFEMVKMRTMLLPAQAGGSHDDADRLTRLGRWLRASSIDELPTLWNVLRGDLSLVGPRPLLMDYLPRYSPVQARRHEVRPGLTGLAQVSGRNGLSWEERFALDVEYVDRRSLGLDLRILARTIATVVGREGVSAEGHATMPAFRGSAETTAHAGGSS
ncbi:sugar transferase [Arsenicicoccus dermatophilus]|uniref:sugar transferase n=1 Tax=Arsenicicoccus dermatophilus TaxID=1076331 RepID=UPI0039174237